MVSTLLFVHPCAQAAQLSLPSAISDQEFWRIVTEFSEPGGLFQPQLMSNEDSAQFVIPALQEKTKRGGVYVGVGSEQNFTYIAAIRPKLAFIVDIRRDNMLQHLMYKALFELSSDRADFLSRLFSRRRPAGLDSNASVNTLLDAYKGIESDFGFFEANLRSVMDRLVTRHQFHLSDADRANMMGIMNVFRRAGPYNLTGSGDKNATYAQLMMAADLTGHQQSYLASEENFRSVQELEKQNLIVPLVGDFAGDQTIARIGQYLKEHDAVANVFYVSNVERYLFQLPDHGKQFYENVRALPLNESSIFIRSVTVDISRRLGIPLSDRPENWRTFVVPIRDCLNAIASGRIQTYRDLFDLR